MKFRIIFILILVLTYFFPIAASAQIKGLLRDKAIEAIKGNKVEEEKPAQEVKEEPKQQTQQRRSGSGFLERKMMQAMGLNNVKFDMQYNFTSSMAMDIETVDSLKNRDKVQYSTFFNPDDKSFALVFDAVDKETGKKQRTMMIFDMKNNAMLILGEQDGERSGMAIAIPPDTTATAQAEPEKVEQYPADFIHPWYSPTGRTKSILGHHCKEYTYKSNEGSVNLWVTNDNKLNLSQAYSRMNGLQALTSGGWAYGMGMVMEMVFSDDASGASTHMLVKDIQPNSPKRIDLTGYQIVGIGGEK